MAANYSISTVGVGLIMSEASEDKQATTLKSSVLPVDGPTHHGIRFEGDYVFKIDQQAIETMIETRGMI